MPTLTCLPDPGLQRRVVLGSVDDVRRVDGDRPSFDRARRLASWRERRVQEGELAAVRRQTTRDLPPQLVLPLQRAEISGAVVAFSDAVERSSARAYWLKKPETKRGGSDGLAERTWMLPRESGYPCILAK